MALFERIMQLVFRALNTMSLADFARVKARSAREPGDERLEQAIERIEALTSKLTQKEDDLDEVSDRLRDIEARAELLQRLVEELLAAREASVAEPETVSEPETAADTVEPIPEPEEQAPEPEEPPAATVEPPAEEPPTTVPTEEVVVNVEKPPTIHKEAEVVRQWFISPTEGRRWHLTQMERGVRLCHQSDGCCSFSGCGEQQNGAHVDLRDGHGIFPVCAYAQWAANKYKHIHKKKRLPRIQYWANNSELAKWKADLIKNQVDEELKRLVAEAAAKEQAAAEAQLKQERVHAMDLVIRQDLFQVAEGSCSVPNCNEPAAVKCLYPDILSHRRLPLCDGHAFDAEALRLEQMAKPKRQRLPFWVFLTPQNEKLFLSRQASREQNDAVVERERAERQREQYERLEVLHEAAEEKHLRREILAAIQPRPGARAPRPKPHTPGDDDNKNGGQAAA